MWRSGGRTRARFAKLPAWERSAVAAAAIVTVIGGGGLLGWLGLSRSDHVTLPPTTLTTPPTTSTTIPPTTLTTIESPGSTPTPPGPHAPTGVTGVTIPVTRSPGGPSTLSPTTASSPPSTVAPITADAISGNWSGTYFDEGQPFTITLDVRLGCGIGQRCGSVYVSKYPCTGGWYLVGHSGDTFQFSVANYTATSNSVCTAGSDYYLTPQSGTLAFNTLASGPYGTLHRV
jgi:hypothetical protein